MKTTIVDGVKRFEMDEEEYILGNEESRGICTACGAEADGCEPDARHYLCEACGKHEVFGIEELLLMGRLSFGEEA